MKKYQGIYDQLVEVYKAGDAHGDIAHDILNKLSKKELKEMNEEFKMVTLFDHQSKKTWVENMYFFGIRWESEMKTVGEVAAASWR